MLWSVTSHFNKLVIEGIPQICLAIAFVGPKKSLDCASIALLKYKNKDLISYELKELFSAGQKF